MRRGKKNDPPPVPSGAYGVAMAQMQPAKTLRVFIEGATFDGQSELLETTTLFEIMENLASQLGIRTDQVKLSKSKAGPPIDPRLTLFRAGYGNDDVIYVRTAMDPDFNEGDRFDVSKPSQQAALLPISKNEQQYMNLQPAEAAPQVVEPGSRKAQQQPSPRVLTERQRRAQAAMSGGPGDDRRSTFNNSDPSPENNPASPSMYNMQERVSGEEVIHMNNSQRRNQAGGGQVYLNDHEVQNMNVDQEIRMQKRRCCQRCTDCCFKSPQFGAIWRWFWWTLWHIVLLGDTFGIVYIGYLLRDDNPRLMGSCAILFLAPWIVAWAGGLSIKEHIFSHKNFKCRCLVQPFAAIYTVLPPVAIVFMLLTELLLGIEQFLQKFFGICFSPRRRQRYYEWTPATAWWRYRRLTQLVCQTILQLGLYAYIYLEVDPFEELLVLENDVLYAAAGVSALSLVFGFVGLCYGARRTKTNFCGYVSMSQRVTPGFILGENRKKQQFDWSLFKFDEYSFASALKILHARHEAGKIYTVILTPKSIKKLNHMSCKHFGEVLRKLNINLIVKHSVHTPYDVWRLLAKRDDFIPNDDIRKKLLESGYATNFPPNELDDILNTSKPGGGRLYYSQFKEQLTKNMPLSRIMTIRNPGEWAQQKEGDEKLVQLLLGYGAGSSDQKSALFHAIEKGNTNLLQHIFDNGDLPTQDDFNSTAQLLIKVTQENDLQTAQLVCQLIRNRRFENTGNPLLQKDTFGNTPLHYAAELGRLELVQLYVQAFTQQEQEIMMAPNRSNQTPMSLAQMTQQDQVIQFLRQFQGM